MVLAIVPNFAIVNQENVLETSLSDRKSVDLALVSASDAVTRVLIRFA